jgi:hypothetical protein
VQRLDEHARCVQGGGRHPECACEHVAVAAGQDTKAGEVGVRPFGKESVDDFVDRAVATEGQHDVEVVLNRSACEFNRMRTVGRLGNLHVEVGTHRFDDHVARATRSGGRARVHDEEGSHGAQASEVSHRVRCVERGRQILRIAAAVLFLQGAALLALGIYILIELFVSTAQSTANAIVEVLLYVVMTACLWLVARGLWRARRWARSPAVVVQVVAGFASINMIQGDGAAPWIGVLVLVTALIAFVSLLTPPVTRELAAADEKDADV